MKINPPPSLYPLLIRTDFSDNDAWEILKQKILSPDNEYDAVVTFIDEKKFENLLLSQLLHFDSEQDFIFIADSISISGESLVLCISLAENYGKNFRIVPSQILSVSNNLFIVNAEFNEYAESVDFNGVYRG